MISLYELHQKFLHSGGISIDTRTIKGNELFFSIHGNQNANHFAIEALDRGARFAVVDDASFQIDERILLVNDTLEALQSLAFYHRDYLKLKVIAITGSNGKTTSKELIYNVLKASFKVYATEGNLNNHIGVPLTLLRMTKILDIAIIEMGANHLGEIASLCEIAKPDYGYITNFGRAHLEGFGSAENIVKAKSELYNYLRKNKGVIFYNQQDEVQTRLCDSYDKSIPISRDGMKVDPSSDYLKIFYKDKVIKTQLAGSYNISNIAAAIGVGSHFGLPLDQIISSLEKYIPNNNRSQILKYGSLRVIADAYNANPTSMEHALESFSKIKGKKLAVLGDMLELGIYAKEEHQQIVRILEKLDIQAVLFGKHFSEISTDFPNFLEYKDLENYLKNLDLEGTTLLVKGSRGMALERLFRILEGLSK